MNTTIDLLKAPRFNTANIGLPRTPTMIRIMIVDDHPVVLKGIAACFYRAPNICVAYEARNGMDALRKASELMPDVVLMDLEMPQMGGLALAAQFRMRLPSAKVIMLTMHHRSDYVLRAIESGVRGYILKDRPASELIQAVQQVYAGQTYFPGELAMIAINQYVRCQSMDRESQLTAREREVLVQIAEGLSNKEIASLLDVGVRTVETHRERIMRKLNIHSAAGLTRYAITEGYIVLSPQAAAC